MEFINITIKRLGHITFFIALHEYKFWFSDNFPFSFAGQKLAPSAFIFCAIFLYLSVGAIHESPAFIFGVSRLKFYNLADDEEDLQ